MSDLVSGAKVIPFPRIIATSARLAEISRDRHVAINEYLNHLPLVGLR